MSRTLSGVATAFLWLAPLSGWAGPPYLTDDPDPVPLHHWEVYAFATRDRTHSADSVIGPALEVNNGVAPNTQIHFVIPQAYASEGGTSARGLGDTEAGVKYRLLTETKTRPEIGVFPLVELPTGDQSRGLGNGRTWVKVPVWLQKSFGPWTTYGGGGYAYNSAPGQQNYGYGGLLVQRTLSPRLTLGGEVFLQGASADGPQSVNVGSAGASSSDIQVAGARSSALYNVGGSYNFTPDFSLLFTVGHSFQGDGNSVLYLGLYRTLAGRTLAGLDSADERAHDSPVQGGPLICGQGEDGVGGAGGAFQVGE